MKSIGTIERDVRRVLADHYWAIECLRGGGYVATSRSPLGYGRQQHTFKTLARLVDYFRPLLDDPRLEKLFL